MKKLKMLSIIMLLLFPTIVFASSGNDEMAITMALAMEAFVTIHMTIFVLLPLANTFDPDKSKKLFKKLFIGRIIILLIFDFFITPYIAIIDFFGVFIGAFLVVPIVLILTKNKITIRSATEITTNVENNVELKCSKCQAVLKPTDKACPKCKTAASKDTTPIVPFDVTYLASEKNILQDMIKEEIKLQGEDINLLTTKDLNIKKTILIAILGLVTLLCSIMYFFNIPIVRSIIIEIIAIIAFVIAYKKINIISIIAKYAINNPDIEISKIVNDIRNEKQNVLLPDIIKIPVVLIVCILIPCVIFFNPRIIYSKYGEGYKVLRYTRGITYNEKITIPETYKNKQVLAIEESAFKYSNIKHVELPNGLESIKTKAFYNCEEITEITIPSTVYEIRSEAFAYCKKLTTVNLSEGLLDIRASVFEGDENLVNIELPSTLEYLGASVFAYCSSLEKITIPSGVIEINGATFLANQSLREINLHDDIISIHGEAFKECSSLESIELPPKITEIRGNTFEYCTSLKSINIPDGVTRIGGHAFYGCYSLNSVTVPSTVVEIGSSAFRQCSSLYRIQIPYGAVVNERAFKESPTNVYRY